MWAGCQSLPFLGAQAQPRWHASCFLLSLSSGFLAGVSLDGLPWTPFPGQEHLFGARAALQRPVLHSRRDLSHPSRSILSHCKRSGFPSLRSESQYNAPFPPAEKIIKPFQGLGGIPHPPNSHHHHHPTFKTAENRISVSFNQKEIITTLLIMLGGEMHFFSPQHLSFVLILWFLWEASRQGKSQQAFLFFS